MKGFIEVTQTDKRQTLVAINEIRVIEEWERFVVILLDFSCTKRNLVKGYICVTETYPEVLAKIAAAVE